MESTKMKTLLFLMLISFFISSCKKDATTQLEDKKPPELITFIKYYDINFQAIGHSIVQTWKGEYIIVGSTTFMFQMPSRICLLKINKEGSKLIEKIVGTTNGIGHAICITPDSGFIVVGIADSDLYVAKLDGECNVIWEKLFGGVGTDRAYDIESTNDGGFIIVGRTSSYGQGAYDVYLIKIDVDGNKLWEKTFGGKSDDYGRSVEQTSDNGYIVVGQSFSFGGNSSVYLIKTDQSGNKEWEKNYPNGDGFSVKQTMDGGFAIVGNDNSDVLLLKTDNQGNKSWEKTYGDSLYDYGHSLLQISDGSYLATGYEYNKNGWQAFLLKTDANGNKIFIKKYGDHSVGYDLRKTEDGGFIITGSALNASAILIIKTDKDGDIH